MELYADATRCPVVEPAAPDAVLLGTAMVAAAGCRPPPVARRRRRRHAPGRHAPRPPIPQRARYERDWRAFEAMQRERDALDGSDRPPAALRRPHPAVIAASLRHARAANPRERKTAWPSCSRSAGTSPPGKRRRLPRQPAGALRGDARPPRRHHLPRRLPGRGGQRVDRDLRHRRRLPRASREPQGQGPARRRRRRLRHDRPAAASATPTRPPARSSRASAPPTTRPPPRPSSSTPAPTATRPSEHGQGDPHDGPRPRRGALDRLLHHRLRPRRRRPPRLRRLHPDLPAQPRGRLRGRADHQQGPHRRPTPSATATATSPSPSPTSTPSTPASPPPASRPTRSRSSTATARSSPASSSCRTPTATRSRSCSGTGV